ncbi:UNVERIFIED_CONTAM: hypothetical protein Sangu_1798500 [Sesamum angustifolium]|uniref:Uncharacterized protein n=1 Tax=Sesamum angustifolium TaxID=2727405 RepID=A0AAW2M9H3_9LAMI
MKRQEREKSLLTSERPLTLTLPRASQRRRCAAVTPGSDPRAAKRDGARRMTLAVCGRIDVYILPLHLQTDPLRRRTLLDIVVIGPVPRQEVLGWLGGSSSILRFAPDVRRAHFHISDPNGKQWGCLYQLA